MPKTLHPIFRVQFVSQDKVFEVFAEANLLQRPVWIHRSRRVRDLRTQWALVDPSEEKLKAEFQGVKRSYIPMHAVIRIDEVEDSGPARIRDNKAGNVTRSQWHHHLESRETRIDLNIVQENSGRLH